MTVETLDSFTDWFPANGANKDWSYDFKILGAETAYIEYKDGEDGAITRTQTDMAFFPNGDLVGGYLRYPDVAAALGATFFVRVVRQVPYTQTEAIGNEGAFFPEIHERAMDRIVMQVQQIGRDTDRALKVPLGSEGGILELDAVVDEIMVSDGAEGIKSSGVTLDSFTSDADAAVAAAQAAQAAAEQAVIDAADQVALAEAAVVAASDQVALATAQVALAAAQVALAEAETDAAEAAKVAAEAAQAAAEAAAASINPALFVEVADTDASGFGFVNETGPLADSGTTLPAESVVKAYVGTHVSVNVRDYGGIGDDVNDDTTAFQNAIDALLALGGGRLYVPAGTWRVDTIDIGVHAGSTQNSRIVIFGDGPATVIRSHTNGIDYLFKETAGFTHFKSLRLAGNDVVSKGVLFTTNLGNLQYDARFDRVQFQSFEYGFYGDEDAGNWHFDGCFLIDCSIAHIHSANNGLNCSVSGSTIYGFSDGGDGIVLARNAGAATPQQAEGFRCQDSMILATGGKALNITAGLALYFNNCVLDQSDEALAIDGSVNAIADVCFENCWFGPKAIPTDDVTMLVSGNVTDLKVSGGTVATRGVGIHLNGSTISRVALMGVRFRMTSDASAVGDCGLRVTQSKAVTVVGCMWDTPTGSGVCMIEDDNNSTVYATGNAFTVAPTKSTASTYFANWGDDTNITTGGMRSRLPDGTAGLPTYSFATDPNTGMYRVASDIIGFAAGGNQIATIQPAGLQVPRTRSSFGESVTVADDAVTSFNPSGSTGIILVSYSGGSCEFRYKTSATTHCQIVSANPLAIFAATTGALTGTTGADGAITVSAHTDGLYIENRSGGSLSIRASVRF